MRQEAVDAYIVHAVPETLESSPGFEAGFWRKIEKRRKRFFLEVLLDPIFSLIPIPTMAQVVSVLVFTAMISSAVGALAALVAQPQRDHSNAALFLNPPPSISEMYITKLETGSN
ncbi:MAG: hypothetical protein HY586_01980 [Candidatus Omnitrophica bacterium]|nr:hypothetical protein [Candidatus Omnitrophota bacterium]